MRPRNRLKPKPLSVLALVPLTTLTALLAHTNNMEAPEGPTSAPHVTEHRKDNHTLHTPQ